jgi:hypothetical protein
VRRFSQPESFFGQAPRRIRGSLIKIGRTSAAERGAMAAKKKKRRETFAPFSMNANQEQYVVKKK